MKNSKILPSPFSVLLLVIGSLLLLQCQKSGREGPPNVVIIFTDDQGYADVGVFGGKGFTTPHLDKMARDGMRLTNFYVSQAVCSASRASLLTGCYAERISIQGALSPRARHGLNPQETTIAEMLRPLGYATGIFGKWHLGHLKEFLPLQHGFDEYFGLPYSNDMWPVHYDGKSQAKGYYPKLPLIDGNETIETVETLEDQAQLTTRYTERAVDFIQRNKEKPFFLYLPHSMPHVPIAASDKFKGKSEQGLYGDVMMEIDWSVGQILTELKENGLEENTIVIFTSDNGPWLNYGNHAGSALPLREGKGNMWEGGARVPFIVRWQGNIEAGQVSSAIGATVDLLPTIAEITGAALPPSKIDGVSLMPILRGEAAASPRNNYYYYYGGALQAVRKGDWKLILPHEYRSYEGVEPKNDGYPGPYATRKAELELYNLVEDISESRNVIEDHPNVVSELQELVEAARTELGDQLTGRKGSGVRPNGRLEAAEPIAVEHQAIEKKIRLTHPFHPKYRAGSDNALVDGTMGTLEYNDGAWQGFEGSDFEAVIDLGKTSPVNIVMVHFLEDQQVWIFNPENASIEISNDGRSFREVARLEWPVEFRAPAATSRLVARLKNQKARYIRVKATGVKTCPPWHPGAGGKSWTFVDEIVLNPQLVDM